MELFDPCVKRLYAILIYSTKIFLQKKAATSLTWRRLLSCENELFAENGLNGDVSVLRGERAEAVTHATN